MNLRKWSRLVVWSMLLASVTSAPLPAVNLCVFYPSASRPQVIQKKLVDQCPGVDITVFGRFKDFETMLAQTPPEAILANTFLVKSYPEFSIKLDGSRGGKSDEPYVLLSIDQGMDPGAIGDKNIAVVDILGRKGMDSFVQQLLPAVPKLKRVTKIEDLLPSLTFNMAQGMLIPQSLVPYFKETSQLKLVMTVLPNAKTGIVALGIRNNAELGNLVTALKKLDTETKQMLGVDEWK